jgi:hypothetical protein
MVMKFSLLPWKPELVFTGLSIMGVNPQNLKFCSHVVISLSFLLAFHSVSEHMLFISLRNGICGDERSSRVAVGT